MIVSFFFAGLRSGAEDVKEAASSASARTADEVRADDQARNLMTRPASGEGARADALSARTFYDSLYTMLEKSIESIFREASL